MDLIKGLHGELAPAQWDGKQTHGIKVVGKTVLILMDEAAEKSSGGILIPDSKLEFISSGAESGVLISIAPGAFLLNEDMTPWTGDKPEPGNRVYVAKYSGQLVRGKDGRIYRLMDYGCIGAVYDHIEIKDARSKGVARQKRSKPKRKEGERKHGGIKQPRSRR